MLTSAFIQPADPPASSRVPLSNPRILRIRSVAFRILNPILDLPRRDIDDQLSELDRVASAFEAPGCHPFRYGIVRGRAKPAVKTKAGLLLKLTHYPETDHPRLDQGLNQPPSPVRLE
jgi:hypothetical protein